jgi:hypothetical protein
MKHAFITVRKEDREKVVEIIKILFRPRNSEYL